LVFPGTIEVEMLFHLGDQIPQALAPMVAWAQIMHIPESALKRVGTRRVGWQKGNCSTPLMELLDLSPVRP
jgi:hypothetical protein